MTILPAKLSNAAAAAILRAILNQQAARIVAGVQARTEGAS